MTAREWFNKAQAEGFAVGAFNVDSLEIFKAICEAGRKKKSPVMLEFSQGEVEYFGLSNIIDMVANANEEYQIPILLNLDHSKKVEDCMRAIEGSSSVAEDNIEVKKSVEVSTLKEGSFKTGRVGFDDIHFDGSDLSYDDNVQGAKKVVEAAHNKGLLVEGELDKLSGSSEIHSEEIDLEALKESYTKPERAAKFVEDSGVDIFASVFGNAHGTFPNDPPLDLQLLKKIKEALPGTFLSMHGGSGLPADDVKEAIRIGKIVKINVNTDIRLAFHDALIEQVGANPDEYAYYKITESIVEAVAAVVEGKIAVFGSAGKA